MMVPEFPDVPSEDCEFDNSGVFNAAGHSGSTLRVLLCNRIDFLSISASQSPTRTKEGQLSHARSPKKLKNVIFVFLAWQQNFELAIVRS